MAAKLTDDEKHQIATLCAAGKSCREIAAEVGRSVDTVSRVARANGHTFGRLNLARAREARQFYTAEARAEIAALATRRAQELLDGFDDKQPVVIGGSQPEVRALNLDAKGQKDRAQAAQLLMRTVIDIDRHDRKADAGQAKGLLEQLVESLHDAG